MDDMSESDGGLALFECFERVERKKIVPRKFTFTVNRNEAVAEDRRR